MGTPPTVVFVPGFMQRGDAWRAVADALAERYPSRTLDPSGATFEGRVREVRDACPPGAVLAGYSMGGRLALHAALAEPDRLRALVLVGASAGIEDAAERAERRRADEELAAWIEASPIESVVERWERNPIFATQDAALVAAQRPGRLSHDPAALASLLRTGGQGALRPVWDRLGELTMPVLALAGERDARYAAAARRIAALCPAGEAASAPGGHAPQLEHPGEVARLLGDFLDRHLGEDGV